MTSFSVKRNRNFEYSKYFNFETNFVENGNFFKKKGSTLFLFESLKIENASSSCKTIVPEVNVKANRMCSTKWTYHKERRFANNYFLLFAIFEKFLSDEEPLTKN